MTFDPHPSIVLGKRNEKVFYITPLEQKLELLQSIGVDTTFVVRFTSDFAQLTPENFVDTFIRLLNVKHVTAGYDFTFGAFGQGNMDVMKKLSHNDFDVSVVEKKSSENEKISSTRIRQALTLGNMPNLSVAATCVRLPVVSGHSESVFIEVDKDGISVSEMRAVLEAAKGIKVQDNPAKQQYPMPLFAEGEDEVFVGRIRKDLSNDRGFHMWIVSDNLLKGAALNSIQIAETMIEEGII